MIQRSGQLTGPRRNGAGAVFRALCACVCALLIHAAMPAFAQHGSLQVEQISIEHGLSQAGVHVVMQDRLGYIWIGTQDGLNRYDGYSFTVFRNDPADSASISNNNIQAIAEDSRGELWIGTQKGLNRFDRRTGSFERFTTRTPASRVTYPSIHVILDDGRGSMLLGTSAGLAILKRNTGTITAFVPEGSTAQDAPRGIVSGLVLEKGGSFWMSIVGGGLFRYHAASRRWIQYEAGRGKDTGLLPGHTGLYRDRAGCLWVYNNIGLHEYRARVDSFITHPIRRQNVTGHLPELIVSVCEDLDGRFWISTGGNGLALFDRRTHAVTHFPYDPLLRNGLTTAFLSALHCDRAGDLWIGTNGSGVNRMDRRGVRFPHYMLDPTLPDGAPVNYVNTLCEARDGSIWVGARNHIGVFDSSMRLLRRIDTREMSPNSFSEYSIRDIVEDDDGSMLIGTGGVGLFRHSAGRGFRNYRNATGHALDRGSNFVFAIHRTRGGRLLIGTGTGLHELRRGATAFTSVPLRRGAMAPLRASVWSISEDSRGRVWVGTGRSGVVVLDTGMHLLARYIRDEETSSGLSGNAVTGFHEDEQGAMWVCTTDGLNRIAPQGNVDRVYTTRDGLPNNNVYGLLEDASGRFWLSTNMGVSRFDPRSGIFRNFDMEDGLQSNEFNQGAMLRLRDGRLAFGGVRGFNVFRTVDVRDNTIAPPVLVTGFRINDVPVLFDRAVPDLREISLSYDQNSFSFEFLALNFSHPSKNRYAYMLEGYDHAWIGAGGRRYAAYTNLDGGDYVFRVRAANNDGIWNETGASIRIHLAQPPWKTWWAYVLYTLALAALIAGIAQLRVRRVLAMERLRAGIAADLHDEIGSSLTKISLHAELIQQGMDDARRSAYLDRIATASRDVVQAMSDVVWSIDARNDNIGSMIDRMRDFAGTLFADDRVELRFSIEGMDTAQRLPADVRQNVYLIFKEALSNAARHAEARHVTVDLANGPKHFVMDISNDGAPKNVAPRRSGHGLRNMALRAARIGGTLETSFTPEGGRVFLRRKAL